MTSVLGLITPLEPNRGSARLAASAAATATHRRGASRLDVAAFSACGPLHATNEDRHSPLGGQGRLFVVADGVGGGARADLASSELVAHLHRCLGDGTRPLDAADTARIDDAVLGADRAIAAALARVTGRPGATTTALAAPLDAAAARWLVAWVGDCRVYRWSDAAPQAVECLTRDDTFGQLGEAPPPGGSPDDPARMVGNGATDGANKVFCTLDHGSLLAICSDGVHKHLESADWCRVLALPRSLAARAEAVVARAREGGSSDDATVLLVERLAWAEPARAIAGAAAARPRRMSS